MLKAFLPGSQEYLDRIRSSDFGRAGFTLDAGLKDILLILDAAAEVRLLISATGRFSQRSLPLTPVRSRDGCDITRLRTQPLVVCPHYSFTQQPPSFSLSARWIRASSS